ncbi:hypothetical protein LGQ02_19305 [Bacillus shivajii]|uniref:hypothetical protein n=1 Tax=Bacillus shivajii TaxID=1983719 RepID=UPI001CFBB156|nr:hypothetical protein [Bacillus shivajii]UCZ52902.1 hypothetical protein LGQ02_19305 [Bacillus shivajii]
MKTLIIGVTAHRTIKESAICGVTQQVQSFFKSIQQDYFGYKIKLQSPLAEGGDRLVAKIALELDIDLMVPLPMEIDDYVSDFTTETSIKEFYDLCGQAKKVFAPNMGEVIDRTDAYYKVGCYTALTSHILLGLWDQHLGLEKKGGTANIIREQFEGFSNERVLNEIELVPNRKTYIIYTPRPQQISQEATDGYWSKHDYNEYKKNDHSLFSTE